jgi:hypothetical protein
MLQVRLPAELFVGNHTQNTCMRARVDGGAGEAVGAGIVMLCPCFCKLYKDIPLGVKRCPMPLSPLQAQLMYSW